MKTILLLQDEARRPLQLLQNAMPAKVPLRDTKVVAGCNSDRWGIRVLAVLNVLFKRKRSFRFHSPPRNEVKHGIPDCV
jgi:hypothetical protein